jgi:Family of unknown function (DUF6541)
VIVSRRRRGKIDGNKMRHLLRVNSVVALLALIVLVGLIWGWTHRSGSVDMALHYALVEFIRTHGHWPTPSVGYIGEMNQYPPGAHTVAAIVALLTGSSFLALHLVSTVSAAVTLVALFVLIRFRSSQATLAATALLATALALLEHGHNFLGREITGNFFYPQMFGEMCVFTLVVLRSRLSLGLWAEIAAAVGATLLLGWVYPIAAVQMAGIAVAWRMLSMSRHWHSSGRVDARQALTLAVLMVGVVAAIVLHPRFPVVVNLATNNGYVDVRISRGLVVPATFLLCAAVVVLGVEFARQRLMLRAPDAFIALCAGVAAASLAQEAAYYLLGIGSPYGVYKHIFAVSTLLVAAATVCLVHFWHVGEAASGAGDGMRQLARLAFVPAALTALAANNVPWRGEPLSSAMATEAFLRSSISRRVGVEGHAVLLAGSRIGQFGFSMGILHLAKNRSLALIYEGFATPARRQAVIATTPVKYAFVSSDAVRDAACAISTDPGARLTLVDYACQFRSDALVH